jgi:hypothetical protein
MFLPRKTYDELRTQVKDLNTRNDNQAQDITKHISTIETMRAERDAMLRTLGMVNNYSDSTLNRGLADRLRDIANQSKMLANTLDLSAKHAALVAPIEQKNNTKAWPGPDSAEMHSRVAELQKSEDLAAAEKALADNADPSPADKTLRENEKDLHKRLRERLQTRFHEVAPSAKIAWEIGDSGRIVECVITSPRRPMPVTGIGSDPYKALRMAVANWYLEALERD